MTTTEVPQLTAVVMTQIGHHVTVPLATTNRPGPELTAVVIAALLGDVEDFRLGGLARGGEGRGVLLVAGLLRAGHLVHLLLGLEEGHVGLRGRGQRHLLQQGTQTQ